MTERGAAVVAGGAVLELAAGALGFVLAIVGLASSAAAPLAAIATIVIGGGLAAHGAAIAVSWRPVLRRLGPYEDLTELVEAATTELLGGGFAVLLGVLALVTTRSLLPIAALALGAALVVGAGAQSRLDTLVPEHLRSGGRGFRFALRGSAWAMVCCGFIAGVLGVLGIINIGLTRAILVAMLFAGVAMAAAGASTASRLGPPLVRA